MEINLCDVEIGSVSFKKMPEPTFADSRPKYRVSLITHLITRFSRNGQDGKHLTYFQINILTWLLNNHEKITEFADCIVECMSLDPINILAINYGASFGFFTIKDDKIHLTDKGNELQKLIENDSVFAEDEQSLRLITKKMISSSRLKELYRVTL